MKLEEVLEEFRSNTDLFKFTRKVNKDLFWYEYRNNVFAGFYSNRKLLITDEIPLSDILKDDWIIDYTDDFNWKK